MNRAERLTALSGRIAALPNVPFNGRECVLAQFLGRLTGIMLLADSIPADEIIRCLEVAVESEERRKR